jgi:hypothetical protein
MDQLSIAHPAIKEGHPIYDQLTTYISYLIQHDFSQLVTLLYRIDINEKKLKTLLATQPSTDSAALIAQLIIDRQLEKKAWRQAHMPDNNIPEEDRW